MNEEINELLSHYQEEKAFLDSLIKESLAEEDYHAAWLHSKALSKIKNQIRIIKSLLDPHASEKEYLKNRIDLLSEQIDFNQSEDYKTYFLNQIDKKLDELNSFKSGYFNDGQEFDDVIFDLIEKRINSFVFHINKAANFYLKFSLKKNYLKINFTPFLEVNEGYNISSPEITALKQIGFRKNNLETYLQYKYSLDGFKDAIFIKTIVSRVIYDVLLNYGIDNLTHIEIID